MLKTTIFRFLVPILGFVFFVYLAWTSFNEEDIFEGLMLLGVSLTLLSFGLAPEGYFQKRYDSLWDVLQEIETTDIYSGLLSNVGTFLMLVGDFGMILNMFF